MIQYLVVIFVGVMIGKLFERYRRRNTGSRAQIVEAVAGFLKFGQYSTDLVDRRRTLFFKLSKQHQELGVETLKRYRLARQCAQANSILMNDLAQFAIKHHNITSFELAASSPGPRYRTFETFNHFIRDFCDLTDVQRNQLFKPIIANLPSGAGTALLPGSGVGGLAFEMSKLGWQVDALEFDPTLHLAAQFAQQTTKSYSVYPWVLEFSHLEKAHDQTQPGIVSFSSDPNIKFLYKNFLEHKGQYDSIVTLFFIDTAENVLDYLEQIALLLKPGGTWINYGPLKWGSAPKIELSLDELKVLLETLGWAFEAEWKGENRYSGSPQSMWSARYQIEGWRATRPGK